MKNSVNPNLTHLIGCYRDTAKLIAEGKPGINACLEGGSRSGKTWAVIDFLVCLASCTSGLVVNIVRDTYNGFKTTLYSDFARRLPMYGITDSPFGIVKDIGQYNLMGMQLNFLGADKPDKFEGAGCDVFWCNEMLDINKRIFDHLEQRCRLMWFGDWNPKYTDHWAFDLERRPEVRFLRTTIFDNPGASPAEKKKILGYEPTPENIARGTADEFMWKVYGKGERASMTGLVFPNVEWIAEFPDDCEQISYGMDFGHTNSPTAIVRVGRRARQLFIEYLFYAPCDNPNDLYNVLKPYIGESGYIYADSAEPVLISALRARGLNVLGAIKKPGSIIDGITVMKAFKLHVVRSADSAKEFNNYKYREINGYSLNEPIDDFNHGIDAARYAVVMDYRG